MSNKYDIKTFQGLILTLQDYWSRQGCLLVQPFDMEVGAGTSHPMTFLRAIGPEPHFCAYVNTQRAFFRESAQRKVRHAHILRTGLLFLSIVFTVLTKAESLQA